MKTFLQETLNDIKAQTTNFHNAIWVVPSKRAAGFIYNELKKTSQKAQILPQVYSVEEFIERLSGLQICNSTQMLFEAYDVYKNIELEEHEDFETFSGWINTLIGDFNEVDRYMLDSENFFNHLKDIQDMEHWSMADKKTAWVEQYLKFWEQIQEIYKGLNEKLMAKGIAHQGMVYKQAAINAPEFRAKHADKDFVFIGFNALNQAEQVFIQEFLKDEKNKLYWDMDSYFMEQDFHAVSLFAKRYQKEWPYFQNKKLKTQDNYRKEKEIHILSSVQEITQVKGLTSLLEEMSQEQIHNTAIVLADEKLLPVVLGSLPDNVGKVNITMGAAIQHFPAPILLQMLIKLHEKNSKSYYYKDIFSILQHPMIKNSMHKVEDLQAILIERNQTYATYEQLAEIYEGNDVGLLKLLFKSWENNPVKALEACIALVNAWQEAFKTYSIQKAVLFELYQLLQNINHLAENYNYLESISSFKFLFEEALNQASVDFEGDAYDGLQIMGVLESRLLDFEHVIILSVNEGIIPTGKSTNSFITYDLKTAYNLPSYLEKDAVYAYHFFRLIQRAKTLHLFYTTDTGSLQGKGEASRYLMQMMIDDLPNHKISRTQINPKISSIGTGELKQIQKTPSVINRIREIAQNRGFSPSALGSYIRNPIEFYETRILRVSEIDEMEESVAANTLGTIVHNSLENLYEEKVGQHLTIEFLEAIKTNIVEELETQFQQVYKDGEYKQGFNLIVYEVAKKFIERAIQLDINLLKDGNSIKLVDLEKNISAAFILPNSKEKIILAGKADRIDEFNGQVRIIDYKSGATKPGDLFINKWEDITGNSDKAKVFQTLCYALMLNKMEGTEDLQTGIISLRNIGFGFMPVKGGRDQKQISDIMTAEVLEEFESYLNQLLEEIFDIEENFIEKEIKEWTF